MGFSAHTAGASGKNVFCTVFPFAPQPFVHGKWESNEHNGFALDLASAWYKQGESGYETESLFSARLKTKN
jgi:hypothetical protein